ncbi:hypothetical protein M758_UG338500 [Ceratodon purpureus]|nr:hypothetical protein M758_UG338500 [Ceratodon purpureus]
MITVGSLFAAAASVPTTVGFSVTAVSSPSAAAAPFSVNFAPAIIFAAPTVSSTALTLLTASPAIPFAAPSMTLAVFFRDAVRFGGAAKRFAPLSRLEASFFGYARTWALVPLLCSS